MGELTPDEKRFARVHLAINRHMNGGKCPTSESLGECAAVDRVGETVHDEPLYEAYLYLWKAAESLAPDTVASWFAGVGAADIIIRHTLHDELNGDRRGRTPEGARQWVVVFTLKELH